MHVKITPTVFENIKSLLNKAEFIEKHKTRPQDFIRDRKLSFFDTAMLVINKTGKTIRSNVRELLCNLNGDIGSYSVQAFSKGRRRIKPDAFKEILTTGTDIFYSKAKPEKFRGYRVTAIDGCKLSLPYHKDSVKEFGFQNHSGEQIQSLSSALYDVINEMVIDANLGAFDASEHDFATEHIKYLASISHDKELIIFDRGYPSVKLIETIEKNHFNYLMRCSSTFVAGIKKAASSDDCIIEHKFKKSKSKVKLRFIKFQLESGNEEYLITNIFDQSFSVADFKYLYHLRWEIETNYDIVKNKLKMESFSGVAPDCIKQDFFATMFLKNLASMMVYDCKSDIDKAHNSGKNKYKYKANMNSAISLIETDVAKLFYCASKRKFKKILSEIYSYVVRYVIPVRPGRSYERKKAHPSMKHPQNQR